MAKKWVKVKLKRALPGTYDKALDQQQRAAKRGLGQLIRDTRRAGTYATSDYTTALGDITRQRGELGEDYRTSVDRTNEDVGLQRAGVERNYTRLANAQRQNFQAAGLAEGGAAAQAAAKRTANRAIEDAAITTAEHRTLDDLLRANTRGGQALDRGVGQLGRDYQRGVTQREQVTIPRAKNEFEAFKTDLAETRMQQMVEGGVNPSQRVRRKTARKWRRRGLI